MFLIYLILERNFGVLAMEKEKQSVPCRNYSKFCWKDILRRMLWSHSIRKYLGNLVLEMHFTFLFGGFVAYWVCTVLCCMVWECDYIVIIIRACTWMQFFLLSLNFLFLHTGVLLFLMNERFYKITKHLEHNLAKHLTQQITGPKLNPN